MGSVALRHFFFGVSARVMGSLLWTGAQTVNGVLDLTFVSASPLVSATEHNFYAKCVIDRLHECVVEDED